MLVPQSEGKAVPMAFQFGTKSRAALAAVHPDLAALAEAALAECEIDFSITEGMRSKERQEKLVAEGKSQTLKSRHITGHAVDVGALVDGKLTWDMPAYAQIADAFRKASIATGIPFEWGCAWGLDLTKFASADEAKAAYVAERARQGKKPFFDGPHFQLPSRDYPELQT